MENILNKYPITCWYKYNTKKNLFEYNHFENGFINGDTPISFNNSFINQKAWKNYKWKIVYGFLIKNKIKEIK